MRKEKSQKETYEAPEIEITDIEVEQNIMSGSGIGTDDAENYDSFWDE